MLRFSKNNRFNPPLHPSPHSGAARWELEWETFKHCDLLSCLRIFKNLKGKQFITSLFFSPPFLRLYTIFYKRYTFNRMSIGIYGKKAVFFPCINISTASQDSQAFADLRLFLWPTLFAEQASITFFTSNLYGSRDKSNLPEGCANKSV